MLFLVLGSVIVLNVNLEDSLWCGTGIGNCISTLSPNDSHMDLETPKLRSYKCERSEPLVLCPCKSQQDAVKSEVLVCSGNKSRLKPRFGL